MQLPIEEAIEILTRMKIEENINNKKIEKPKRYVITKEDLINFCIKLCKVVEREYR